MKNFIPFILAILISLGNLFAQSPQKFNYQAVARDASGNLIANQAVSFRISILQGSASGTVSYSETHNLTTNAYGQVTLAIGTGTVVSGTFSSIGWGTNNHYIKTEMDATGGSIYAMMGTSQLLSVPYAFYSNTSGSSGNVYTGGTGIDVSGNTISNTQPNATHTGDATGDNALTVVKIQGHDIAATSPTNEQVLKWNASTLKWEPATDNNTTYTSGTGINILGTTINNAAPDQTVTLNGTGATTVSGSYPNFTINSTDNNTTYTSGTGINISGTTINNAAPDQNVTLNGTGATTISGTYPDFTINSTDNNTTYTSGTGINISGTTINNAAPDQNVTLTSGTGISATGTYPNFTVTNTQPNATHTGDVTGTYALTVERIQGQAVSATIPASNQVLQWNGTQWTPSSLATSTPAWSLTGNSGTSAATNFIGTTDNVPLVIKVNNEMAGTINPISNNTAWGYQAYNNNSTGTAQFNTALGSTALYSNTNGHENTATGGVALYNNTSGCFNTANGASSLFSNKTGFFNTANGVSALRNNESGYNNTANGVFALNSNIGNSRSTAIGAYAMFYADDRTTGHETYNTAVGFEALMGSDTPANNTGINNTAIGGMALYSNTTGQANTANGKMALYSNTTGWSNTANGIAALYSNTTGNYNSASGSGALYYNTTGGHNTAYGSGALSENTIGANNTAHGSHALYYNKANSRSTAIGMYAMFNADDRPTGQETYNTAVGYEALKGSDTPADNTGQWNTAIGDMALSGNTSGHSNTATGVSVLANNTTGIYNTATGRVALYSNTTGNNNTAYGSWALFNNKANSGNTAVGSNAMQYANNTTAGQPTFNTAVGCEALKGSTTPENNIGYSNTAVGSQSLFVNSFGSSNTAIGANALNFNTTGYSNTATGRYALSNNTEGTRNTANGSYALFYNQANSRSTAIGMDAMRNADDRTNGQETYNTAVGYSALAGSATAANNTGQWNTAIGDMALTSNTSGNSNTATGVNVLANNTTGIYNTATGHNALFQNTAGYNNSAYGTSALKSNKANSRSTAIGAFAMYYADDRPTGQETYNTAVGYEALLGSTTAANNIGRYNTAIGDQALYGNTSGNSNSAFGKSAGVAITNGSGNTCLGFQAGDNITTGSNNIIIGLNADAPSATSDNQLVIGSTNLLYGDMTNNRIGLGGVTTPTQKLDIDGQIRLRGGSPGTGKVLTSAADGTASWQTPLVELPVASTGQTLRSDGTNWLASSVLNNNGTALGVGASPLLNTQLYVFRPSTAYGADYTNIYAKRSGASGATNGGTSWGLTSVDAAIKAYSFYGNTYSAAMAGYSDLDYANSAAVFGSGNSGSVFGALGFKDASANLWAGYFEGKVGITDRLGIGTTSTPAELLHVNNTAGNACIRLSGATGANISELQFYAGSTYRGAIGSDNDDNYVYIYHGGNIFFKNGRIGIQSVNNPTYAIELPNSSTIGTGSGRAYAWTTYSDKRIKSEIKSLPYGINEIMKLQPVSYNQHGSTEKDGKLMIDEASVTNIGFIAQDVFTIIPEVVNKPENDKNELWSMSYEKLLPLVVKGMQEQQTQIEKQNSTLEKQNLTIEKLNSTIQEQQKIIEQLLKRLENLENK
jgi:hypothetical protein